MDEDDKDVGEDSEELWHDKVSRGEVTGEVELVEVEVAGEVELVDVEVAGEVTIVEVEVGAEVKI